MFKWMIAVVLVMSGLVLGFLYVQVKELEKNPGSLPVATAPDAIRIAHAYRDGAHRYAGLMYLPNSCHEVKATITRDTRILENFDLRVTTVDQQLNTAFCSQIRTRYQFSVLEEGPEKVNLRFFVNGKEQNFSLSEGAWQNAGATLQTEK